jgi:phosphohistidine phosphatase
VTEIFLIRHARAVELSQGSSDADRALVPEGWRETRAVGAAVKQAGARIDVIVSSPLVRAVQTATLIGVELGVDGIGIDHALVPEGRSDAMLAIAAAHAGRTVALVGHEPSMGQLLSDLIGRPGMSLVKAGVVKLHFPSEPRRGAGQIGWTISPRQLTPK